MRARLRVQSLPVVPVLLVVFAAHQAAQSVTAPYAELSNDLTEYTNFHPEPFAGIEIDVDGGILAVNPYNNTYLKFSGPTDTSPDLRVQTGHNPVSIGVWNPGPTPADRRVIVVCTGSHAAFLHDPSDGRILNVVLLDSEPADLVIDQENDRAFVSCRGENTVVEIDLPTFTVGADGRFPIPCGQRPGPLHLDSGNPAVEDDERVYVASIVTGNNSTFAAGPASVVGIVLDLDQNELLELPDEDIFRIDPSLAGADAVTPVVKRAGSLIFEIALNPATSELWILSSESNNKGELDTEPKVNGKVVINQLKRVANVLSTSTLLTAADGLDLDDLTPGAMEPTYQAARSLNQSRTIDFQTDGEGFVAGPLSDVLAKLATDGSRVAEFALPRRSQCYAVRVYDPDESIVLALCLGTMTIEVFTEGTSTPGTPLPLGNDPTPGQLRAGRDILLDGQISEDGRSSCLACHEGFRSDQLGWSIAAAPSDTKDVMVTQSLLSIEDTFPHHWRGERDLDDFQGAFTGLLGAPEELAPGAEEMEDVNAFFRSLRAPANPLQSYRRLLDDRISPLSPDEVASSAVRGQDLFRTIENFNGNTCAECHTQVTGSNGNMLFEVVTSFMPRAQELEVAHLRQLQHKGIATVTTTVQFPNGPVDIVLNQNGFGATHNGASPSVFRFIMDTLPFVQAMPDDQDRRDIFEFVEQYDQGIAPGVHWAGWYRQGSSLRFEKDVLDILIGGSESEWLDAVAFGRFHDGTAMREARWLYDRAQNLFVTDDPVLTSKTWNEFKLATQAGLAQNAFLGVPLGNGFRFAFDPDFDHLATGAELAQHGTDPWNPHTDGDRWPDGYEVANGENPLVPQSNPGDDALPGLLSDELQFVTARLAKWFVSFTEDSKYVVQYGTGAELFEFRRDHFVRQDTFVLTHPLPSTPADENAQHKPVPDGSTVFTATITITDRAGRTVGPLSLLDDFTPLAAQGQLGLLLPQPGVFPTVGSFLHVGGMSATLLDSSGSTLTASVTIDTAYHWQDPVTQEHAVADGRVVVCTIAVEDPLTGDFVQSQAGTGAFQFTSTPASVSDIPLWEAGVEASFLALPGIPGPFVLSPPTVNGSTQLQITHHGLAAGQKVKISVQGILIPLELDDGAGGTEVRYFTPSLFHMQPLLTEDAAPDSSGPVFEGTLEIVIPKP